MRIIFAGTIGRSGLGGQAWACLQYLLGFRALGHEVLYLEDCGDTSRVWDWEKAEWDFGLEYPARFVAEALSPFGWGDRWVYRTDSDWRGLTPGALREFCAGADLLIMRGSPLWTWRSEYERPARRAFIDVDPGFTQISLANGDMGLAEAIARCERRFSIAQRIGAPDCPVPDSGGPWLTTVSPVFLPEWEPCFGPKPGVPAPTHFSSIVRWQGFREVVYRGVSYGQRDREFPAYLRLPALTGQRFRLAQMGMPAELQNSAGWEIVPGEVVSRTPEEYRAFIRGSRGELSIPKHGYVRMRAGWFSDRSACYLASGRPVLVEDTGLADWLPVGTGLVTFTDIASAAAGIERINSRYQVHQEAARSLAETVFSTEKVLPVFLEAAMS